MAVETAPPRSARTIQVGIIICPECLNYYGASSMAPDMKAIKREGKVEHRDENGDRVVKGTRIDCPNGCGEREHRTATVVV